MDICQAITVGYLSFFLKLQTLLKALALNLGSSVVDSLVVVSGGVVGLPVVVVADVGLSVVLLPTEQADTDITIAVTNNKAVIVFALDIFISFFVFLLITLISKTHDTL